MQRDLLSCERFFDGFTCASYTARSRPCVLQVTASWRCASLLLLFVMQRKHWKWILTVRRHTRQSQSPCRLFTGFSLKVLAIYCNLREQWCIWRYARDNAKSHLFFVYDSVSFWGEWAQPFVICAGKMASSLKRFHKDWCRFSVCACLRA